jgi:uncharacterized protein (TIGR02145 family)
MKKLIFTNLHIFIMIFVVLVSCKNDDPTTETPIVNTPLTDSRDNKIYKTVTIGSQTWMAENLDYRSPTAGTVYCYNDKFDSCTKYGALYTWDAAKVACPNGWRLPSDSDWKTLEFQLGMAASDTNLTSFRGTDQGTKLKEGGSSGFNSKGVGYWYNGSYWHFSSSSYYWTSTDVSINAYVRQLAHIAGTSFNPLELPKIDRSTLGKSSGFCVRCMKN